MKFRLLLSMLPLLGALTASGDEANRLTFMPEHPQAGSPVTLNYTPLPSMTGHQTINGVAYTYKNQQWTAHDLTLKHDGDVWKGTFTPGPETGFVAFKFVADTIVDNNGGMAFATMINKEDGRPWPEGYVAWGLLRQQRYGNSIPGYIDFEVTPEVSDTIMYYWVNNEISYNPSSAIKYAPLFARAAANAGIDNAQQRIDKAINFLIATDTEESLSSALEMTMGTPRGDSLRNVLVKRFPQSNEAMRQKYFEKYDFRNQDSIKKHLSGFIEQFPYTPEREAFLVKMGQGYDNVYTPLMYIDVLEGNNEEVEKYFDKYSFMGLVNTFYRLVDVPHGRGDKTDAELLPMATKLVECMYANRGVRPDSRRYLSQSEWEQQANASIENYIAETYSEILKGTGNYDEALKYSQMAQKKNKYMRAEINDNMAEILKALGRTAELKSLIEKSYFYNQVSPMQTDMLREIYVAEHNGSADGFDAYTASLGNAAEKSALLKEVEEYRVEGTMPQWTLTDAAGKSVSWSDMKDKVYVIDFWASWCGPCKRALPGMQLAVDHFKDDPNVEFLFVITQEDKNSDYKEKAVDYLNKNNLANLHLVFDGDRHDSNVNDLLSSQVMKQYTISGIPLKVVVDGKGNMRFLSVGYKGSPSALRDEMIEMVQQAKN